MWYNGRKSMYAVNNTVVVDHDGLLSTSTRDIQGLFTISTVSEGQNCITTGVIIFITTMTILNMFSAIQVTPVRKCS